MASRSLHLLLVLKPLYITNDCLGQLRGPPLRLCGEPVLTTSLWKVSATPAWLLV